MGGWTIDLIWGCDGSLSGTTYTTGPIASDCEVTVWFMPGSMPLGPIGSLSAEGAPRSGQTAPVRSAAAAWFNPDTFGAGVRHTFQVAGHGGVPANATAAAGILPVTGQTASGWVPLGPVETTSATGGKIDFPVGARSTSPWVMTAPTASPWH